MDPITVQMFRPSTARMKINQNPYVIFQGASQFSFKLCKTQNSSEIFLLKQCMLWAKKIYNISNFSINVQYFKLLGALMKVHPIPHVIFETTGSGFIQTLHHCSVLWKITPLYFLAETSYTLDKNSPLKWNFGLLSG